MVETLSVFSSFLDVVLAGLLILVFGTIKGHRATRLLLIALIAVGACYQKIVFLSVTGRISDQSLWYQAQFPLYVGSIPLLYIYIRSITERNFTMANVSPWHFLPFVGGWILRIVVNLGNLSPAFAQQVLVSYVQPVLAISIALPYLRAAHAQVNLLNCTAKESNCNLNDLRLPWLKFLLNLWFLSVLVMALDLATGLRVPLYIFKSMTFTLELLGLAYYGLRDSRLFLPEPRPGASSATLSKKNLERRSTELIRFLQKEQFYLRPQISLTDLAEAIGIKNYLLSEVINRGLGSNFYDLVNGLRIEKAKAILQDPATAHLNLQGVAMDCGFNSKSSFNECFRRFTGMTPSKFRELHAEAMEVAKTEQAESNV